MKIKFIRKTVVIALTGLFLWSCEGYGDQFGFERISTEVELSSSIAAPVAFGEFSLEDIIQSLSDDTDLLSLDENNMITVYFSQDIDAPIAGDLLPIPDQVGKETYIQSDIEIPAWIAIPPGTTYTFVKEESLDFLMDSEDELDSLTLSGGQLSIETLSDIKHDGILRISSSSVIDPVGDSLNLVFPVSSAGGTFSNSRNLDLADYTILLSEGGVSSQATIYLSLTLTKSSAAIGSAEKANIDLSFEDIEYEGVYGKIAQRSLDLQSANSELDFFNNIGELTNINFADPQFNMLVRNSFGIPISLDLGLRVRSSITGEYTDLEFKDPGMNPIIIQAQTIDAIGEYMNTTIEFNKETTNIDEILSSLPDRLEYSISTAIGSNAGSTEQNFILRESGIEADVEVIMPLYLSTSGITLKQKLDLDVDELLNTLSFIDTAGLSLRTTNEWPFGLDLQVYFLDEDSTVVSTLFDGPQAVLAAAPVISSTGLLDVASLEENIFDVTLTRDDIEDIEGATQAVLEATIATSNNGQTDVKFVSDASVSFNIGILGSATINTNLSGGGDNEEE